MQKYTKQEIADLANLFFKKSVGRYDYQPTIKILINVSRWHRKSTGYTAKQVCSSAEVYKKMINKSRRSMTDIHNLVCITRISKVRKVLFEEPLEKMPLYINTEQLSIIAKYRLNLGE